MDNNKLSLDHLEDVAGGLETPVIHRKFLTQANKLMLDNQPVLRVGIYE